MKVIPLFISALLSISIVACANTTDTKADNSSSYPIEASKITTNVQNDLNKQAIHSDYDFSKLLITKNQMVIGILGDNYKRLIIIIDSVKAGSSTSYQIKGKSQVKNNITPFSGILQLKEIYRSETIDYGIDDQYANKGIIEQGTAIFNYELKENRNQKYSGIFKGQMQLKYYKTTDNNLHYDDIRLSTDGYYNRLYQGKWIEYGSNKIKKASWADYSLPNSVAPDLNIGAGEFVPNPKYYEFGWRNF